MDLFVSFGTHLLINLDWLRIVSDRFGISFGSFGESCQIVRASFSDRFKSFLVLLGRLVIMFGSVLDGLGYFWNNFWIGFGWFQFA